MRASLDTDVIIHFYRADLQNILFEFFEDGVFIYEQIRKIELENHARDLLDVIDADIESGKIEVYTDEKLKKQAVFKMFETNVNENRLLYGSGDLGEVYAISLAKTIGAYSLLQMIRSKVDRICHYCSLKMRLKSDTGLEFLFGEKDIFRKP